MSTIKLLDISYFLNDYAINNATLFKFLAHLQSEICYYVWNVVYCTVFNLCPKIPSQEFLVYKMLSAKEVTSLLMQMDYY